MNQFEKMKKNVQEKKEIGQHSKKEQRNMYDGDTKNLKRNLGESSFYYSSLLHSSFSKLPQNKQKSPRLFLKAWESFLGFLGINNNTNKNHQKDVHDDIDERCNYIRIDWRRMFLIFWVCKPIWLIWNSSRFIKISVISYWL